MFIRNKILFIESSNGKTKIYNEIDPNLSEEKTQSDWIIRFEFDKQTMMNKNITMENIYHKIMVNL